MKWNLKTWIDFFDPGFEWFARGAIAVGAASVAFIFVPTFMRLRFTVMIAVIFGLYHLFGILQPRLRAWCRAGLATGMGIGLIGGDWMLHQQPTLLLKLIMAFIVWSAFTLLFDVLDLPHASYWKARFTSDRKFGAFDI